MSFFTSKKKKSFAEELEKFQSDCITELLKEAGKLGVPAKETLDELELLTTGKDIIQHYFSDSYTHIIFGDNADKYYNFIMCQTLRSGVESEIKWHESRASFPGFVTSLKLSGPSDRSQELLDKIMEESPKGKKTTDLYDTFFACIMKKLNRYWDHEESQEFTERAMLAVFQLGICIAAENRN